MLHWFLGPRLLDPGTGRERGVTTHTRITDQLEVMVMIMLMMMIIMMMS